MQEALKQQPESVFLYTELARLQMRRGDMAAALQACQQAIALAPDHRACRMYSSGLYTSICNRRKRRKAAFRRAIALDPMQEDGYLYLGTLYAEAGKRPEAIEVFQELLRQQPTSVRGLFSLGRLYAEDGAYEQAEALLKRAAAQQSRYEQIFRVLGTVYEMQKRYEDAIAVYQRALQINPYDKMVRHRLGELYIQQRAYDEALTVYNELQQLEPRNLRLRIRMGLIYLEQKRFAGSPGDLSYCGHCGACRCRCALLPSAYLRADATVRRGVTRTAAGDSAATKGCEFPFASRACLRTVRKYAQSSGSRYATPLRSNLRMPERIFIWVCCNRSSKSIWKP